MPLPSKISRIETTTIFARGKLLLTAEYFVLDGALALALPTKAGQTFKFTKETGPEGQIHWRSFDHEGQIWFEGRFTHAGECLEASDEASARRLSNLFQSILQLGGVWPQAPSAWRVEVALDFPRHWGLGSSSTLIAAMAKWTGVDAYKLLAATFGGSGYDLACAFATGPILYQRREGRGNWVDFPFAPPFLEQLYFVGLGAKQDSREGIARYRERNPAADPGVLQAVNQMTLDFISAGTLEEFERCMREHENLVSKTLDLPCVAAVLFPDFWGAVKSLGAWGGDFVMATSSASYEETVQYFYQKGYTDVFRFKEMGV